MTIARYFFVAALATALTFFVSTRAFAQADTGDASDPGYSAQDSNGDSENAQDENGDQDSDQAQTQGDDDDSGGNVAVPVPGGGEVQADEPQQEAPNQIPPNEPWSTRMMNPGVQGDSPQGP